MKTDFQYVKGKENDYSVSMMKLREIILKSAQSFSHYL